MITLRYQVDLLEPVIVTALEGDPNSAVAYKYLPGSVIRGALIGKTLSTKVFSTETIASEDAGRDMFFNGKTRYLNAYIASNGERSLPTPQSWRRTRKDNDTTIHDALGDKLPDDAKPIKAQFFVTSGDALHLLDPEHQISVHTFRRDRNMGRPQRGNGNVFQYEALAAGQTFMGLILCDEEAHAETLWRLLQGEYFIGGARSAGYGRVAFSYLDDQPAEYTRPTVVGNQVTVTLLSDLILRDEFGQYSTDPCVLANVLAKRFGHAKDSWKEIGCILKTGMVGGFNQKWGLPLPQMPTLQAGSVFRFALPDGISLEQLDQVVDEGIGERRLDGFGRIAFAQFGGTLAQTSESKPEPSEPNSLEGQSREVAELMVRRIRQQRLQTAIVASAQTVNIQISNTLKKAQIGRLRTAIRDALSADPSTAMGKIREYLESVDSRQKARKQLEAARVDGKRLSYWIKELLEIDAPELWHEIFFPSDKTKEQPDQKQPKQLFGIEITYDQSERDKAILHLIDAVLVRFAKETRGEEES